MGSTYLELTNKVLRRLNEVELTDNSFASCRGIHLMAKEAVLETVRKINAKKFEWPFNSAEGSQTLVVGQEEYTWPADLRIPDWESFYIENDGTIATKTTNLNQIAKDDYRHYLRPHDLDAGATGTGIPKYIYELSSGGFGVSPSPDAAYVVKYTYFIKTITLEVDSDVCTIPEEYDYVIVEGALVPMYKFLDNTPRSEASEAAYKDGLAEMTYILIPKDPRVTDARVSHTTESNGFYWGE